MQTEQLPFIAIGDHKLCCVPRPVTTMSITDSEVWQLIVLSFWYWNLSCSSVADYDHEHETKKIKNQLKLVKKQRFETMQSTMYNHEETKQHHCFYSSFRQKDRRQWISNSYTVKVPKTQEDYSLKIILWVFERSFCPWNQWKSSASKKLAHIIDIGVNISPGCTEMVKSSQGSFRSYF